jgi:hypothetical protein
VVYLGEFLCLPELEMNSSVTVLLIGFSFVVKEFQDL